MIFLCFFANIVLNNFFQKNTKEVDYKVKNNYFCSDKQITSTSFDMAKITLFSQVIGKLPKEIIRKIIRTAGTDKHCKGYQGL